MKIVYIGDNRVRGNFGCRATSTALSLLIGKKHSIVGRITGKYTHFDTGELFFVKWLPAWIYKFLGSRKYWKYLKKFLYLYIRMIKRGGKYLFGSCDFISHDLDQSIENLIKLIPANPIYKEFDLRQYEFDALVINGEGSFIFSTPPWRESLVIAMEMYWALKMGKKVYFLNAMFSDDPKSEQNQTTIDLVYSILKKCEVVQVRENFSFDFAKRHFPNCNLILKPDALFSWFNIINDNHKIYDFKYYIPHNDECDEYYYNLDFNQPYALIAGSSAGIISKNMNVPIDAYCNLVEKAKAELKISIYLIQVCEGDEFLKKVSKRTNTMLIPMGTPILAAAKILANARVFISGRYHPAIMASQGGTPCVFMSSNSHKTLSIQELLEYDYLHEFEVIPDNEECSKILNEAKRKMNLGEKYREKIKDRCIYLSAQANTIVDLIK